jgi:hypothetical protein
MTAPILLDPDIRVRLNDVISRWWRLDILIVTDTIVSFGPEHDPRNLDEDYFGMSHLVSVLEGIASVTKAHRHTDPLTAPGVLEHFTFDNHDLSAYDQIWLLGYQRGGNALTDAELGALARFMNAGGGVFATGDHEDLGSALASGLPRVRSMRRWASPPPALGSDRVDTVMPDHNGVVVFENQSDDIPQTLRLKWYEWSHARWTREVYPHPLLCSSEGAITGFPDHMHEGEVVEPDVLDRVVSLPGLSFEEYPEGSDGQRVVPEVVAWGHVTGYSDPEVMHGIHTGDPQQTTPRWNGTVGAYDGHRAGVGRVAVDSTWHHFFDINLIGDNAANRPTFTDPRKALWSKGFTYSTEGQAYLAKIDQYYRNIAHWLSPRVGLFGQWAALTVSLARSKQLIELLVPGTDPRLLGLWAWQTVIRRWPPCLVLQLAIDVVLQEIPRLRPIPWGPWDGPRPGPEDGAPRPPVPPTWFAQAALGGALLALARIESLDELAGEAGPRLFARAAAAAVTESLHQQLRRDRDEVENLERVTELFERQ